MIHFDEEKWASQYSREPQESPTKDWVFGIVIILVVTLLGLVFS